MSNWKRDFVSGLIVLVPLIVTAWVAVWLFSFLAGAPIFDVLEEDIIIDTIGIEAYASQLRIIITLVVFVAIVFAVGWLMRTAIGELLEATVDNLMNRLPGVRIVYNASKVAIETALGHQTTLQAPVKVEPWDGMRMTAFKTGKQTTDGREIVFMPTAPNITTGFVMELEEGDFLETDERVEEALTRLLSAGFGEDSDQQTVFDLADGSVEPDEPSSGEHADQT